MNRLKQTSLNTNKTQFLSTQNVPIISSPSPISNPITINKVTKQGDSPSLITPSKPPRDFKISSKNFNPTKTTQNINQMTSNLEKSLHVGDFRNERKEYDIKPKSPKSPTDIIDMIKRRLDALKILQMKNAILETKFYEELYLLECKYNKMFKPLKELRRKIVIGDHEPNDEECKMNQIGDSGDGFEITKPVNSELEKERELSKDLLALNISNYATKKGDFVKGIPEFWLTVLKRVGLTSQMIEQYDEPILKYLYDIDIDLQDKKPFNFTLRFYFYPNEYFTNEVLTKTYEFKIELDANDPYVFEAPETMNTRGCKINWKKNKDVTRKSNFFDLNNDRTVSFFNFFDTIDFENLNRDKLTCDDEAELAIDFEIGYTFKEKVIPRAILYYMGEINDDDDEDDDGLDEDEEDHELKLNQDQAKCSGVQVKNLNKN